MYCALVRWVQLLQKKRSFLPQWQPQKGGQCNRRMMPSECFASKAYTLELDLPDEVLYRYAGNMVPVPYTTRFIQAVVAYLEKAGHKPELEPKCDEYRTYLDPALQDREDERASISCKCAQCKPTAQQRKQRKAPTRDKVTSVSASKCEVRRKVMSKKDKAQRLGAPKVRKGRNQVHNQSMDQLKTLH